MKNSLHVRRVYWSSLNSPMCYVWDYGIASNWIFMGFMWTGELSVLPSMPTDISCFMNAFRLHAPDVCHFSCTSQSSCYQQIRPRSIRSGQTSDLTTSYRGSHALWEQSHTQFHHNVHMSKIKKKKKKEERKENIIMWRADTNNCIQSVRHTALWYTFYHQNWKLHQNNKCCCCCPGLVQD